MNDQHRRSDGDGTGEAMLLAFGALVIALGMAHWLAVRLAAVFARRAQPKVSLAQAVIALAHLPAHLGDPRQAWPIELRPLLPGPLAYQVALVITLLALAGLAVAGWGIASRRGKRAEAINERSRLGVDTEPHLASTRDLKPLLIRQPERGRFILGHWGRRYLATEATTYRRRRGIAGAVAVIGPSQSGKTTGLIEGVALWDGPAIVCSVKTDLLRATIDERRERGDVKVFDPFGISGQPTTTWSPLRAARHLEGATAAAALLTRTDTHASTQDAFWRGQAEQLIAAMLWTAANTQGHTMRHVVKWVLELDRADDANGTLAPLVRLLTDDEDQETAVAARQVQGWLQGQWKTDPRTTSSVYATARDAIWPWASPRIAKTADSSTVDLVWLLDGPNTLYLCAPLGDERLGLVFATLLQDLIEQAFDHANGAGPPTSRILALIDETANTPLPRLPQWASTVTGAGIQLVTVWQSKAQIDQLYDGHADTVLTNHRTKLIYPSGLSDLATIDYISQLIGDEHARGEIETTSAFGTRARRDHATAPAASTAFLPAHVLRRVDPGDALLAHGSTQFAWVRSTRRSNDASDRRSASAKTAHCVDQSPRHPRAQLGA